jgi:hypothetical protein
MLAAFAAAAIPAPSPSAARKIACRTAVQPSWRARNPSVAVESIPREGKTHAPQVDGQDTLSRRSASSRVGADGSAVSAGAICCGATWFIGRRYEFIGPVGQRFPATAASAISLLSSFRGKPASHGHEFCQAQRHAVDGQAISERLIGRDDSLASALTCHAAISRTRKKRAPKCASSRSIVALRRAA